MKIVCLRGSPRTKGNSSTLAQHFCDAAEKLGATIQTFALNKLNFRGCQACMACKTKLDKLRVTGSLLLVSGCSFGKNDARQWRGASTGKRA